jgi:hypothetical protein
MIEEPSSRDLPLMNSIKKYLGCGNFQVKSKKPIVNLVVSKFSDINEKIIPFFDKYPLQGTKILNYADFCKIAELMKSKTHLTLSGIEQIREIKDRMNRKRDYSLS